MGAGFTDGDDSYVSTDGAGDEPRKTKAMVCTLRFIWGKWGEMAYKRRATREVATFRDRKKIKARCTVCGATVAVS